MEWNVCTDGVDRTLEPEAKGSPVVQQPDKLLLKTCLFMLFLIPIPHALLACL